MKNQLLLLTDSTENPSTEKYHPERGDTAVSRNARPSRAGDIRAERARRGADEARRALRAAVKRATAREEARRQAREAAQLAALTQPHLPFGGRARRPRAA